MTFSRSCIIVFSLLLIALSGATSLHAQQSHWNDLNTQVLNLVKQGKYAEAVPIAKDALKAAEAAYGPDDPNIAVALNILAMVYMYQDKYAEAEPLYHRALPLFEKTLGPDNPDLVQTLKNFAIVYDKQGKYSLAVPLYQRVLAIQEKALGPEAPMVVNDLNNLAVLYFKLHEYANAQPLMERALRIAEKILGPEDPALATDLSNLAMAYVYQDKYAEAEPLYQRGLPLYEKTLGPENPDLAQTINNFAHVYDEQGKYALAEPLYQRTLAIREKALGPENPDVATVLNNLAALYDHQGKYAQAEPLYLRALAIREKALGPESPQVANTLNNLATLYDRQVRYAEAEPLYLRALKIDENALVPDDPGVAADLNNLGAHFFNQGLYAKAEHLYQGALEIDEKALGPDNTNIASALNNLAGLYVRQGKYSTAEPLYQRTLRIYEKALGPEHNNVAIALNNLAALYVRQGKYTEAESLYQRALQIREKALSPDHVDVAISLNNLAALNVDQGKYADAERNYLRAQQIFERALGPNNTDLASDLNNLAQLYFNQRRFREAEPLYQRALGIDEKVLGPAHPGVAVALNNLALFYDQQGRYAAAEPLYRRALHIDETTLGPDHPDLATDLNNLALLYDHQDKYVQAEPLYQRAFNNLFDQFQYNFTYMSEKERLGFLDTVADDFPVYFSFVHRFRNQDPRLIGSMYNLLLWEKSFIAGSVADMRRQVEASGDPEALKLLEQLSAKRTQIAALLNVVPPDRDFWRKQIDQLRTEANDIEKSLVARSSAFAEHKKLDRATWQQVRDALKPGEAAVEFARFSYYDKKWTDRYYYAALVVTRQTKDHPQYIFLGDDKQMEGAALTSFQRSVKTRGASRDQPATLPGASAWDLIWKPLEPSLAGSTLIYLSPDGVLNQIPLGIIPAPGGKLQMERYDLRLLSSTRDILRSTPPPAAATALLVGDPVFDLTEDQQRAATLKLTLPQQPPATESASSPTAATPNQLSRDQGTSTTLPRLPGTGAEVNAIAQLMRDRQWKTSVYTSDLALKQVVEQAGIPSSPRVIHLATHGFFLPDQQFKSRQITSRLNPDQIEASALEDPMLRSGLYFAGANRTLAGKPTAEGLDNGVLTAMEAGSLNLRGTELVVLSACNTGQGDVKNGEGVFGLRRAFQEAGAQSVLMSLWSVPDKETLDLMQSFYTKWLAGMEIHLALKEAQLETREQVKKTHNGNDLPYYWGAFVLVGR
jgi:tetratricopeptide (TPR) repeat protein